MSEENDRLEIKRLLDISAHAADRRDFVLMRSLYIDGAYEDHGEYKGDVDGFIEWAKQAVSGMDIASHLFLRSLIIVKGDEAESESVLQVFFKLKGPPSISTIGICRQFDRYARTSNGWRFSRRVMCFDWSHNFEAGEMQLPPGTLVGRVDAADPFYSELPMLAAYLRERAA